MLGEAITNAALEGTGEEDRVDGVGLLPTTTRFDPEKTVEAVTCELSGVGPPAGANGEVSGYEIHAGETEVVGDVKRPFIGEGAATDRVLRYFTSTASLRTRSPQTRSSRECSSPRGASGPMMILWRLIPTSTPRRLSRSTSTCRRFLGSSSATRTTDNTSKAPRRARGHCRSREQSSRDDERRLRRLSNQRHIPRWRSDSGRSVTTLPARPRFALQSTRHSTASLAPRRRSRTTTPPLGPARRSWLRCSRNRWRSAPPSPRRIRFLNAPLPGSERYRAKARPSRPGEGQGCGAVLAWSPAERSEVGLGRRTQ